jgi:phosphonate transport system substrate-binding protein
MNRLRPFTRLALVSLCVVLLSSGTSGEDLPAFRIGFSAASFADVNPNDASAALKVWARNLAAERRIAADPQPKILKNLDTVRSALTNHLVDAINLTSYEYFHLRNEVALDHFVLPVQAGSFTEEYLLLVHRESGIKAPADLKGRTLGLLKSPRTALAHAWLDVLLAEHDLPQIEHLFESFAEIPGITKVVLSVFFRRTDACVVTRSGFETMLELSPRTANQLVILATSPPIVPSVFGFRTGYDAPIRDQILADIARWHQSPSGKQILKLLQCDGLEEHPISVLHSTVALMADHLRLCGDHTLGGTSAVRVMLNPPATDNP